MYAKSMDGINWSTPVRVLAESQDNTMDGSYDIFQNGSQLYLVWQDAGRQFSKQDDILDVLNSLSVRFAVLDTQKDIVTENMELTHTPGYICIRLWWPQGRKSILRMCIICLTRVMLTETTGNNSML